jgi:hypothetical protein
MKEDAHREWNNCKQDQTQNPLKEIAGQVGFVQDFPKHKRQKAKRFQTPDPNQ